MKKYSVKTFQSKPEPWVLTFELPEKASGKLLTFTSGEKEVFYFCEKENELFAVINTHSECEVKSYGKNSDFEFSLKSPVYKRNIKISWCGFSFSLFVDGILCDEEWPIGYPLTGEWEIHTFCEIKNLNFEYRTENSEQKPFIYDKSVFGFCFPGHNTGVGDCMPFNHDGVYRLFCLYDRRSHACKKYFGAHRWAQISSADLKEWTVQPIALGITDQSEGSICTGSLIRKDEKVYAFYSVRETDGSAAKICRALSNDGVHFEKSDKGFSLEYPYEAVSARDPEVFLGADGIYHMLVTTSLLSEEKYNGCLAHLESEDLQNWTQREAFIVPGFEDQPECSNYFEFNGWYYLVFSIFGSSHYRMSKNPFGPWICPLSDCFDSLQVRVPKTARFGERYISAGFLSRHNPENPLDIRYAGNLIMHELVQHEDGTLGVKSVEEILPKQTFVFAKEELLIEALNSRKSFDLPEIKSGIRLKAAIKFKGAALNCGILIRTGKHECKIEFKPYAGTVAMIRDYTANIYGIGRDIITGLPFDRDMGIDLVIKDDIADLVLDNGRSMTFRTDENVCGGVLISLYALNGQAEFSDINLFALNENR